MSHHMHLPHAHTHTRAQVKQHCYHMLRDGQNRIFSPDHNRIFDEIPANDTVYTAYN